MTIDRIYVSEATLNTIERYGQNNMTNVSGKLDGHLCVEFVRAAPTPTVASDAAASLSQLVNFVRHGPMHPDYPPNMTVDSEPD